MEMLFDISQDELPIFLAEVDEHLQVLDEIIVQLERDDSPELVQKLFRAAHTLKGMAGMIGHHRMTRLTHTLETAFDGVRKNTLSISTPLIDLCLDAVDSLRLLREEVVSGQQADVNVEDLIEDFQSFSSGNSAPAPSVKIEAVLEAVQAFQPVVVTPQIEVEPVKVEPPPPAVASTADRVVLVQAKIEKGSIASGARAFQLMMALQELGDLAKMSPTMEEIEASKPVSEFSAELTCAATIEEIWKKINWISEVESAVVGGKLFGGPAVVPQAVAAPKEETKIEKKPVPAVVAKPAQPASARSETRRSADMTVRTTVERLDALMNLVGELITDRNHLYQLRGKIENHVDSELSIDQLSDTVGHLGRITDQLQEEVMRIRMLPIGNVFNKFPRMVRDMAQKTGKLVDLVMQGEDTELDRSMIEEINDPLIHLLRNSVDHGLETPEERLAAGKSRNGTVTMTARYEQGRIVLTVQDDGRGIDHNKIRRAAVSKGLISEEEAAALTEDQAVDLIFLPGLSTASKLSEISGRGVGMDIVHTNIQRVNGTISVETHMGQGSIFTIHLPLTLAIVPTLLVKVAKSVFAIPLVMVTETRRLTKNEIKTIGGKPVTLLRGHVLPLLHLSTLFDMGETTSHKGYVFAVVVHSGKQKVGLVVDSLTGQEEVVVKSLSSLIGDLPGISSAAILGDGKVALILDVPGLLKYAIVH
jgi:two-component system chemotaxis sensor kinase CheA